MKKKMTLEEAMARIAELEAENEELKKTIEEYKSRKVSGRKKHNEKWRANLQQFTVLYEEGVALVDIAQKTEMSLRTVYRYKEYYDKVKNENK